MKLGIRTNIALFLAVSLTISSCQYEDKYDREPVVFSENDTTIHSKDGSSFIGLSPGIRLFVIKDPSILDHIESTIPLDLLAQLKKAHSKTIKKEESFIVLTYIFLGCDDLDNNHYPTIEYLLTNKEDVAQLRGAETTINVRSDSLHRSSGICTFISDNVFSLLFSKSMPSGDYKVKGTFRTRSNVLPVEIKLHVTD